MKQRRQHKSWIGHLLFGSFLLSMLAGCQCSQPVTPCTVQSDCEPNTLCLNQVCASPHGEQRETEQEAITCIPRAPKLFSQSWGASALKFHSTLPWMFTRDRSTFYAWDPSQRKVLHKFPAWGSHSLDALAMHPTQPIVARLSWYAPETVSFFQLGEAPPNPNLENDPWKPIQVPDSFVSPSRTDGKLHFAPDGSFLLVTSRTQIEITASPTHPNRVKKRFELQLSGNDNPDKVLWSPDGSSLIVAYFWKQTAQWYQFDTSSPNEVRLVLKRKFSLPIKPIDMAFTPDSKGILLAERQHIRSYQLSDTKPSHTYALPTIDSIKSIHVDAKRRRLFTVSEISNNLTAWNLESAERPARQILPTAQVKIPQNTFVSDQVIQLSPQTGHVFVSRTHEHTLTEWKLSGNQWTEVWHQKAPYWTSIHPTKPLGVVVSESAKASNGYNVSLVSLESGAILHKLSLTGALNVTKDSFYTQGVKFSPSGDTFLTFQATTQSMYDQGQRVPGVALWKVVAVGDSYQIRFVRTAPVYFSHPRQQNSSALATYSQNGRELWLWLHHTKQPESKQAFQVMDMSPDASGLPTLRHVQTFTGQDNQLSYFAQQNKALNLTRGQLSLSPSGTWLVGSFAVQEGTIIPYTYLWKLRRTSQKIQIESTQPLPPPKTYENQPFQYAFDPLSRWLFQDMNFGLQFWQLDKEKPSVQTLDATTTREPFLTQSLAAEFHPKQPIVATLTQQDGRATYLQLWGAGSRQLLHESKAISTHSFLEPGTASLRWQPTPNPRKIRLYAMTRLEVQRWDCTAP